ncbi:MAG TPA: hypothetical protein VMM78_15640 [Thermomicrobiales bacterium]|nr:hypothetical protein [Thermomicrobiales bacterium]
MADDECETAEYVESLSAAIAAAGLESEFDLRPGARHWFFESHRPDEFDPDLSELAFQRTPEFLDRQLRPGAP